MGELRLNPERSKFTKKRNTNLSGIFAAASDEMVSNVLKISLQIIHYRKIKDKWAYNFILGTSLNFFHTCFI